MKKQKTRKRVHIYMDESLYERLRKITQLPGHRPTISGEIELVLVEYVDRVERQRLEHKSDQ